ncbi:hypothetical protein BHM03_00062219 [Ensete ventricosum]|nr:hypothetical protein BHM03_00062219 [Ensete ventricosum]
MPRACGVVTTSSSRRSPFTLVTLAISRPFSSAKNVAGLCVVAEQSARLAIIGNDFIGKDLWIKNLVGAVKDKRWRYECNRTSDLLQHPDEWNSRIHLALADQDSAPPPPPPPAKLDAHPRVNVVVNATVSKRQLTLDADATDTVGQFKARIQDLEGIPASRFVLFHGGAELQDHQTLADCGVADDPEVSLVVRPFPPSPPSSSAPLQGSKKLRLMVLPKCGTKKVPVDVNASDNVSELRKELQRLYGVFNFHLPTDGYFFIYKQNVMDEDKSFRWHDVKQGDTIEIFNGSVTGGS